MQAYQNSLIKKTDKEIVVFVSLDLLHDPVLKYAYYVDKTPKKGFCSNYNKTSFYAGVLLHRKVGVFVNKQFLFIAINVNKWTFKTGKRISFFRSFTFDVFK